VTRLIIIILLTASPVFAQATRQVPSPPIDVTGATFVEFDDSTGIWMLRGSPVAVTRGATTVRAPAMAYDSRQQIVRATGGVTYADPAATFSSAQATVWLQEERLLAEGDVSGMLREGAQETHLRSNRAEAWRKDRRALATGDVQVRRGEFTLTSSRVEYLEMQHKATATGRSTVTAPEGRLSGDRMEVLLDREEGVAEGNVEVLVRPQGDPAGFPIEGRAPKAVLRRSDGMAILSGGATVRQGQNTATAQEITVDLRRNRVVATGQAHLVLYPPQR
jgi:lipopolysaccharide export system protein LptA